MENSVKGLCTDYGTISLPADMQEILREIKALRFWQWIKRDRLASALDARFWEENEKQRLAYMATSRTEAS